MESLCFEGNYTKRINRIKEVSNDKVEVVIDKFINGFCNYWLESEFCIQSGALRYERTEERKDYRGGHYFRRLITTRGILDLKVPRGEGKKKYDYSLFKRHKRKTDSFEDILVEAILKGHSSRKASKFFKELLGTGTVSHQAALQALRRFDYGLEEWRKRPLRDNALILVLDAKWLKGAMAHVRGARPVLFAYAVYPDGTEEVLDFELAQGESMTAWSRLCQKLSLRGLKNVRLVVRDDSESIKQSVALVWPQALDQLCVFHMLKNFNRRLTGHKNKREILKDASWVYEAESEQDLYKRVGEFSRKWKAYKNHRVFVDFYNHLMECTRYFKLPKKYWSIARTSNRLERFFEELERRIRVFRRFQNPLSCQRWLYALIVELKPPKQHEVTT